MSGHVARVWGHTVRWGPALPSLGAATRVCLAVGLPLALLLATGHLNWALYAGFGGFAALYARYDDDARRLWKQASAGATLLTAMLLGTAVSVVDAPVLVEAMAIALVACGANLLSTGLRWAPPGPIFAVFAAGACLSVPATAWSFVAVLGVGGGTVLWSLLLALGIGAVRRGGVSVERLRAAVPGWTSVPLSGGRSLLMGLAALVAGVAAHLVLGGHWYWASLAAIAAVMGADAHSRVARGVQRFLGTAVGVVLAAGLFALELPAWALFVVVIIIQGLVELIILRNYGVAMGLVTVLALSMIHLSSPAGDAKELVLDRLAETGFGAVIGIAMAVGLGMIVRAKRRNAAA